MTIKVEISRPEDIAFSPQSSQDSVLKIILTSLRSAGWKVELQPNGEYSDYLIVEESDKLDHKIT